jgi:hypothetical protein
MIIAEYGIKIFGNIRQVMRISGHYVIMTSADLVTANNQIFIAGRCIVCAAYNIVIPGSSIEMASSTGAYNGRVGPSATYNQISDSLYGSGSDRIGTTGIKTGIGTLGVISGV